MGEYWGATAGWTIVGPSLEVMRYTDGPDLVQSATLPDGLEGNDDTIAMVRERIETTHPEDMALLADQWVNMATLLASVRDQLLGLGTQLADKAWRSPEARQAFLERGPGKTLAFIDEWIDAAWRNVTILRAAVGIARQARLDIEALWRNYERDVHEARYRDFNPLLQLGHLDVPWQFWDEDKWREEWNEARDELRSAAVRAVQDRYDSDARQLAYRVAQSYVDTYVHTQSGFGPYFRPMDTLVNEHAGMPGMPSLPSLPVVAAPPVVPPGAFEEPGAPPTPNGIPTPEEMPTPGGTLSPDGVPTPGGGPVAPGGAPAPGSPGAPGVPPVIVAPSMGPSVAPSTAPLTGPASPVTARSGGLPTTGLPGQAGAPPPMSPPGAPRGGVLRRPGQGDDPRLHGPGPTEESFSMPPGSSAPPVLNNPRTPASGRRQGTPAQPGVGQEQFPTPPAGATPPVLSSPGRARPPLPTTPPRERGRERDPATVQPGAGDLDWLALDALRAAAGRPVVDAPAPPGGAAGEPPAAIRASQPSPAGAGPDVTARRVAPRPAGSEHEAGQPVTDEAAFTVETPGGAVVTKQRQDPSQRSEPGQRSEPPAALSGPGA